MTLDEAKEILNTWTLPMDNERLETYKQALAVVAAAAFKVPTV